MSGGSSPRRSARRRGHGCLVLLLVVLALTALLWKPVWGGRRSQGKEELLLPLLLLLAIIMQNPQITNGMPVAIKTIAGNPNKMPRVGHKVGMISPVVSCLLIAHLLRAMTKPMAITMATVVNQNKSSATPLGR